MFDAIPRRTLQSLDGTTQLTDWKEIIFTDDLDALKKNIQNKKKYHCIEQYGANDF